MQKRRQEKKILPLMVMNQSFIDFHYERLGLGRVSKKPVELTDRRAYTELFTYHDEFLQHLYTGHKMLYDSDEEWSKIWALSGRINLQHNSLSKQKLMQQDYFRVVLSKRLRVSSELFGSWAFMQVRALKLGVIVSYNAFVWSKHCESIARRTPA